MTAQTYTCQKCGAEYAATVTPLPSKDKDSWTCETTGCDGIVHEWKAAATYSFRMVKTAPLWPPGADDARRTFWTFLAPDKCEKCGKLFEPDQTRVAFSARNGMFVFCSHCGASHRFRLSLA